MSEQGRPAPKHGWRAALLAWTWLAISVLYVAAFASVQQRLPSTFWMDVPGKYDDSYFQISIGSVVAWSGWILGAQVIIALYATLVAAFPPGVPRDASGRSARKTATIVVLIAFVVVFLASFLGAEALLASVPQQLDRAPIDYYTAKAELGVFSNPIADGINGAGIAALVVGYVIVRVRRRRQRKSVTS